MARFTRLETITATLRSGVVPLFHHPDPQAAIATLDALAAGGARVVEFTNRGDGAHEVFAAMERHAREATPDVVLGVGSVVDAATAALYLGVGASFVVAPSFDPEVARVCNRRKVAYLPGCLTPTEIGRAEEHGCEIVKLFPGGAVGGPSFVQALRGPSPWSRIMPTGGVEPTEESLRAWFSAGVACVGIGSKLVSRRDIDEGRFDAVTERTRGALELTAQVRPPLDETWF